MVQSHERHSISVVTPVYNGEASVGELCRRLAEVLPHISAQHEIILVNDGSRDRSWEMISELCSRSSVVRGLNLMRNYGQHNALLCGIRAAKYDLVITIDDDLQHPPEEIPQLLARLDEGFDVVYGAPKAEQNGPLRALASHITRLALRAAVGSEVAKNVSAFRVFPTELREAFAAYQSPFVSIDVLLTWATTRFAATTVTFQPRHSGSSNYTFTKLIRHALDMMTGFSTAPLQLASLIGFTCTLFGLGVFIYVFVRYCLEGSVPGFPFLASIIAIFSGAQLFALGVIGEYLARMHFRSMKRPAYVVRTTT
ncbi:MAG TPA: glycosyltransferase family 2 protein [Candidatus Udaeobacter sp.]|jgi:undecaprenyl-phosphate 4-deoxy-4-formamido-L-arabinose transferase|nr:glycosyltransferase family 2 protein [Candidatus Udaeobacter sp.]